jgi:hypothetical protein
VDDPWGLADPPAGHAELPLPPLPPRLAALAGLTEPKSLAEDDPLWAWPAAEELPEVRELMAQGWYPLDGAPLHGLLPTVWPTVDRCWLPDRLPKVSHRYDGAVSTLVPSGNGRHEAPNELVREEAVEAGLPLPPTGRIWLLRSPFPSVAMRVLLRLIWQRSEQVGHEGRPSGLPRDMVTAGRELLSWSEDRLLEWWSGREADAAQQWTERGRSPMDMADVVVRGLAPADLEPLLRDGLTEAEVVAWYDVLAGSGRPLVETVRLWRRRGVDLDQTQLLTRLIWWPEEEVSEWVGAGFGWAAMVALAGTPLMRATEWRDSGYTPADTVALLQADELLSPAEATAFAPLETSSMLGWVECGFGAAEAAAWAAADVRPQEARVWRAQGLGPPDVEPGQRLPPDYQLGGWIFPPADPRDLVHQIDDPPGVRGRVARERREHSESMRVRAARAPGLRRT